MTNTIQGSGGGKGGGESARVAQEAPDSLQSRQYAKVLDLVSEGEIGGLVNGLQSIFINDTALQNENGTYNFSGISVDGRVGTQSQTYLSGFPSIENEVAVSTEVKYGVPITRSISNQNINAARVTVSVPTLTEQNTSNGDLGGATVSMQILYQNNGGGFIPARVNVEQSNLSISGLNATSGAGNILGGSLGVNWQGDINTTGIQVCNWIAEYRSTPSGSWTQFGGGSFSGTTSIQYVTTLTPGYEGNIETVEAVIVPPSGNSSPSVSLVEGTYEFRVTKISGNGSLSLGYAAGSVFTSNVIISGKTTSKYQRSYRVDLPSPGPWDIRVVRTTPDSTSSALQNRTFFDSYTEIVDAKLSYPNSAIFGVQVDAKQFSSIPSRAYEIYGIKIKVPDNYNPITRVYTGEWSGNFQIAWSDNPAWIFYDLATSERYGLGEFISPDAIDKWSLYTIAQYCDELVPTGLNGQEPRFTCNTFIQTRYEAYDLLTQLASVFRAMAFWSAGQITCVQDKPSEPIALFTAANIIEGKFNYSGSSVKTRHTVCLVTWNDPLDRYKQKVEYVEDEEGIARYGVSQTEVLAFGCISRGQAHRVGRWILYSERMETETVTFKAGMDSALIYPGAIIQTQDQFRSGKRFGGRTFGSTASSINLDSPINIESGKTYEISIVQPNGTIESRGLTNAVGLTSAATLVTPLTSIPLDGAMWVLSANDLVPEQWRVISITEAEPNIVEISALTNRPDKYAAIEQDLILEPINTTSISTGEPQPVTNMSVTEALYLINPSIVGNSVIVSWTGDSPRYIVSYSSNGDSPQQIDVTTSSYTFTGVQPGVYTFSVQPINTLGRRGIPSSITQEIYGLSAPPSDVVDLRLSAVSGSAHITFNPANDLDVKVGGFLRLRHSKSSSSWNDAVDIGVNIAGSASSVVVPLLQGRYFAKWVDGSGNESVNAVSILTDAPSIINLNVVESIVEHPSFNGTKTNVGIDEFAGVPAITLDSQLTIDEMLVSIDSWPMLSSLGGASSSGMYLFANNIDLGHIFTSRVTADLQSWGYNPNDTVDLWIDIDSLSSIEGNVINDVSARLWIRTSNDAIIYSEWTPLFVGDYTARAFEFKLELVNYGTNNIAVTQCSVQVDMPDIIQASEDIVSGATTYSVTYPNAYYTSPALGITAQNMQTGDYYEITNKLNTGFDIIFKDQSNSAISRVFDYIAKGY